MKWICDRTLYRFVVLWEWSIGECRQRAKDAANAFGIHDEGPHVVLRIGVGLEIGDVIANPFLLPFIPPNLSAARIPGLTLDVAGCAVVKYAPVGRPRPGPVGKNTQTRRIFRSASCELRSGFSPGTGVDPVTAQSGAVIFHPGESG